MPDENETPRRPSKVVLGVWAACALLVILYALLGPFGFQGQKHPQNKAASGPKEKALASNHTRQAPKTPDKTTYSAFEETLGAPLLDRVKHIDYALLQSLFLT